MSSPIEMKRQDLIELYQLLVVYKQTYFGNRNIEELIDEITDRFRNAYKEDIKHVRNPRNAGRKCQYTEENIQMIKELRKNGYSLRKIAEEMGCSLGRVQNVLKNHSVC